MLHSGQQKMFQINQFEQYGSKVRAWRKKYQEVGFEMDLQQIDSRLNQWTRLFDFGPKEALWDAKTMREPLQQIIRYQKGTRTNDGAEIHSAVGRGRGRKGRKRA